MPDELLVTFKCIEMFFFLVCVRVCVWFTYPTKIGKDLTAIYYPTVKDGKKDGSFY